MPQPTHAFHFYVDELAHDAAIATGLEPLHRFVYARAGSATVDGETLAADEARYLHRPAAIVAGPEGATLWRCELAREGSAERLVAGDGVSSVLRARHAIATLDLAAHDTWLFRCDGNAIGPGRRTPPHVHPGPGLRCLIEGAFTVVQRGAEASYRPGETWYETNTDAVVAATNDTDPARFVRFTVLPPEYQGAHLKRVVQWHQENVEASHGKPGQWLFFGETMVTFD